MPVDFRFEYWNAIFYVKKLELLEETEELKSWEGNVQEEHETRKWSKSTRFMSKGVRRQLEKALTAKDMELS